MLNYVDSNGDEESDEQKMMCRLCTLLKGDSERFLIMLKIELQLPVYGKG